MDKKILVMGIIMLLAITNVGAYDKKCTVLYGGTFCFNGTSIIGVNMTVDASNILNPFWLNITDQRYNDSTAISNEAIYRIGNDSTKAGIGTCADGYAVQNTTTSGVQCTSLTGTAVGDGNNYTTALTSTDVGNTITIFLNRSGMTTLNTSFTDSDTDTTYTAGNGLILTSTTFSTNNTYLNTLYYNISNPYNFINMTSTYFTDIKDPTGFVDTTTSTLSFNHATRNFTLSGTYYVYINGTRTTHNNDSITIPTTAGLNYIYYDNNGGLKQSTTAWNFEGIAQVATIYWDGTKGLVGDERHGIVMDWQTHEYLHETIGTRYASGLAGTFNNTNITIGNGEYYDDDLEYILTEKKTCKVVYHQNTTHITWLNTTGLYMYKNATNLYYDNTSQLVAVPSNQYMAMWIFATNDKDDPIMCLVGQRVDTTIASARENNQISNLVLTGIPLTEMKVIYRVILDNDASPYYEATDYRTASTIPTGSYVATDHGTLTGLTDDDHTQYLLRTDAVTALGNWTADKQYYNNITTDWTNDSTSFVAINSNATLTSLNLTGSTGCEYWGSWSHCWNTTHDWTY